MKEQTILERTKIVDTSIGSITLRELMLEDIQFIIADLFQLYEGLDKKVLGTGDGLKILLSAVKDKQLAASINNMVARAGGRDPKDIASLGICDTLKLAKAFLQVNPVREMIDLFLELKDTVVGPAADPQESEEAEAEEEKSPAKT